MNTIKRTFTSFLAAASLGICALATLTGCGNNTDPEVTPTAGLTATVAPTSETTPSATPAVTDQVTPSAEATPTAGPEPTAEPTAVPTSTLEMPYNLPSLSSFDHLKDAIDREISDRALLGDAAYAYKQTTTYNTQGIEANVMHSNSIYSALRYFPWFEANFPDAFDLTALAEEVCYMDDAFQPMMQIFTLTDGKQVTLYTAKKGYALDPADGAREYLYTFDETVNGLCTFISSPSSQNRYYTCFTYDAKGNILVSADYHCTDKGVYLTDFTTYTYNENGSLRSEYNGYPIGFPIPSADNPDPPYETRTVYEYDDADNLIAVTHETTDALPEVTKYFYHKDENNRLTGWTEQHPPGDDGITTVAEYSVKYYADGSVLVYTRDDSYTDEVYKAEIFIPDTELRQNLETTSHLRAYWGSIDSDRYFPRVQYDNSIYDEPCDYDSMSFFGIPGEAEDKTLLTFYGLITGDMLKADTWKFDEKAYSGTDLFYTRNFQRNKDRHLTRYELMEGSGLYANYKYDEKNYVIREEYHNFDEHKIITYTYDKNGLLTGRERQFTLEDTGSGSADITTTYHYAYASDSTLNNMTADTVSNTSGTQVCTTVLTDLSGKYNPDTLMNTEYSEFASENAALLREHKEQYLTELRKEFKDIPIRKLNLLYSKELDEHKTVEIYEYAVYGHAPEYVENDDVDDYGFLVSGIDDTKELYHYAVFSRFLIDGCCVEQALQTEEAPFELSSDTLYSWFSSTSRYEDEAKAVCEMVGLPFEKSDIIVVNASVRRPVSDPDCYYSVILGAYYLDDQTSPVLVEHYCAYESNDGGTYQYHLHVVNGGQFDLSAELNNHDIYTWNKNGSCTQNALPVEWTLFDVSDGVQVVMVNTHDSENTGFIKTYLYVNKHLILLSTTWYC